MKNLYNNNNNNNNNNSNNTSFLKILLRKMTPRRNRNFQKLKERKENVSTILKKWKISGRDCGRLQTKGNQKENG